MWFESKNFDGPIPAGAGAGGNLFDYLLCRKSCRYPGGYVKDDRPRCVQPETHNISRPSIRSIVDVFHAEGFSTMRRFDSTFDTTDPHEAFCPVPLTVRGTQALVSFAPLAFKLFCAARQNAVLRRSSFPPP